VLNPLRFGDKYILLDQIGAGGVAEVFRGKLTRQKGFEKLIVIKKLLPEHTTDREMVNTFISEARLAALLQHENIAATYDFGELDGEYFLAMEYLFGKNLYSVMARARDHHDLFTPAHALAVCSRICEGMEYAHNLTDLQNKPLNLVHRDLTPQNIFVTYDGKVKILDFGVAKAEMFDNKTREGVVKGKISYMSPERLSGVEIDLRSDIFSIGILLYEMLSKTRMYQGDTAELIRKSLTADYTPLREVAPDLDPRIYEILDRALAVDIGRRYRRCADMQADLDDLIFEMGCRGDSKFLKDSIQHLFAQEFHAEQNMVTALFTGFDEAILERETRGSSSVYDGADNEQDKTIFLVYQPAVQMIKSTTAGLVHWYSRTRERIDAIVGEWSIDKRVVRGGLSVVAGIVLLVLITLFSGDGAPPPGEEVRGGATGAAEPVVAFETAEREAGQKGEPGASVTVDVVEKAPGTVAERAPEIVKSEGLPAVGRDNRADGAQKGNLPVEVTAERDRPPVQSPEPSVSPQLIPKDGAKVPVLKTGTVKKVKRRPVSPPDEVSRNDRDTRPAPRETQPEKSRAAVDVSNQTMSFEEEAATHARRRTILMLHTRAEEAMEEGRLLEPAQKSAYSYYHQALEIDPADNRAGEGLRRIADTYAEHAEAALAGKRFDRSAAHVANGLKAWPGYQRLLNIEERVRREREEHIHELSEKARLCLDAGKLSVPADDSAYYYYNEILRIDPDSDLVQQGYRKIGDTYAAMADHSFQEFNYDQAEKYVRRGLQVTPDHYYLLSLKQELERSDLGRVGHSMKKRINKLFSE